MAACGLLLAVHAFFFARTFGEYRDFARYHVERHVRAGRWLAAHTPKDAVVATHDIGAIAFYSQRRIVDITGLVTPEVVPHILKPDYIPFLERLFAARHVTYLAVLQEWQAVDNQTPLFEADPNPEVLDIYDWRPGPPISWRFPCTAANCAHSPHFSGTLRVGDGIRPRPAGGGRLRGDGVVPLRCGPRSLRSFRRGRARLPPGPRPVPEIRRSAFGLTAALANLGRTAEARTQLDSLRAIEPGHSGIAWLEQRLSTLR